MKVTRLLLCAICLLPMSTWAAQTCVVDDFQRQVCVGQLRSVISLAPHLTELFVDAGGLNVLKATDTSSNFPEEAANLPKVGDAHRVDLERLLAYKPDLVLLWGSGSSPQTLSWLDQHGIPVYVSEPKTLEQVADNMADMGRMLGHEAQAEEHAKTWLTGFDELKRQYRDAPTISVFYQVWESPLMSVGAPHIISQLVKLCGGRHVLDTMDALAGQVSLESVVAAKPALIVTSGPEQQARASLAHWQRWKSIPAVATGNVVALPNDILVRQGPRLLAGAQALCAAMDRARK